MSILYNLFKPVLLSLNPEKSHNLAIWALSKNLAGEQIPINSSALESKVFGLNFKNPVGLAAGFDKNAECLNALSKQNFGFLEVGTCTPLPQEGNPQPRLFRFKEEGAVVNRMGFNNGGIELFSQKLRQWKYSGFEDKDVVIGANIGKNKNSANDETDYIKCIDSVYGLCDYLVINISSPNTPGLREMQKKDSLANLLTKVKTEILNIKTKYKGNLPVILKISPDESEENLVDIAEVVMDKKINGVIISNTSIDKKIFKDRGFAENKITGGISGKPLFKKSTQTLERFYILTEGKIPLIGVGGISSAEDAYEKICKGASLVQLYSALVYNGFDLITDINKGLIELLKRDGFSNISEAVGSKVKL